MAEADGRPLLMRQGRAMERPSKITLRFRTDDAGQVQSCWLGGSVRL